jgi:hypothetical protein
MIRFIDLRQQGTLHRFAFWDTCVNRFLEFSGSQAWDIVEDLKDDVEDKALLERLLGLMPAWAMAGPIGNEEDQFWGFEMNPPDLTIAPSRVAIASDSDEPSPAE